jgi:lipopolysaccharide/colanic/teichoic acid biosynthesis glycosyltransferase
MFWRICGFSIVFYKNIYHFNHINNLLRNMILIVNSERRILWQFLWQFFNLENFVSELSQRSSDVEYAVGGQTKRLFDVVFALYLLLLTLPLFIIVTVVLKVTDPGPVIYRHVRIGLWGRRFTCFKFRTMVVDLTIIPASERNGSAVKNSSKIHASRVSGDF